MLLDYFYGAIKTRYSIMDSFDRVERYNTYQQALLQLILKI